MKKEAFVFETAEPWAGMVQAAGLLSEIEGAIKKHVVLSDAAAAALAVWVLHTYTFELRDVVAYVAIESPEKRCGKTTLISVLAALAHRPLIASNITTGALFRAIDTCRPTLFIDEADTFLSGNGAMRGMLNAGNTWRTAYVLRFSRSKGEVRSAKGEVRSAKGEVRSAKGEVRSAKGEVRSAKGEVGSVRGEVGSVKGAAGNSDDGRLRMEDSGGVKAEVEKAARPSLGSYGPARSGNIEHRTPNIEHRKEGGGMLKGEGGEPSNFEPRTLNLEVTGMKAESEKRESGNIEHRREGGETGLRRYSCWCPKVIALIGEAPDTIADRSIVVKMSRKLVTEARAPLTELDTAMIRSKCARFALDARLVIAQSGKIRGDGLNDRAADTFEPLYVIARHAGEGWEEKLQAAAQALSGTTQRENPATELLLDILSVFAETGREKIFSRELAAWLRDGPEGMRSTALKESALNEKGIARMLRPYGIKPTMVRIGTEVSRGYVRTDFMEALRRYVPRMDIDARLKEFHRWVELRAEADAETS